MTSCWVENRFSSALYIHVYSTMQIKENSPHQIIENSEIVFLRLSQSWLRFLHKWELLIFLNKYITESSSRQSKTISPLQKKAPFSNLCHFGMISAFNFNQKSASFYKIKQRYQWFHCSLYRYVKKNIEVTEVLKNDLCAIPFICTMKLRTL